MSELQFKRQSNTFFAFKDDKMIGYAHYNPAGNYIDSMMVKVAFRKHGVATALVRAVAKAVEPRKLNRCPDRLKNDAIRQLSAKLGTELGQEAK